MVVDNPVPEMTINTEAKEPEASPLTPQVPVLDADEKAARKRRLSLPTEVSG